MENCRKCHSTKIEPFKKIHHGKKIMQFHYGIKCLDCKTSYNVPRTKELFDLVKDIPWKFSKNARKRRFYERRVALPLGEET